MPCEPCTAKALRNADFCLAESFKHCQVPFWNRLQGLPRTTHASYEGLSRPLHATQAIRDEVDLELRGQ